MRTILNLAPGNCTTRYLRFAVRADIERQRVPSLEHLLACADAATAVSDWRADAFRTIAQPAASMPGVGAAALYAHRGPLDAASVFVATPVHYLAEISNVRLPAEGILKLGSSEAEALASDFNRVWTGSGFRLIGGRGADLYCAADQPLGAATCDPEDVLGQHIESYLPTGAGAAHLRRLMSEIEMWLFEHAVNRARNAKSAPAVNGLWLWGGGPALDSLPVMQGWAAGDDVFFNACAAAFAARTDAPPQPGPGVVVIAAQPGAPQWLEGGSPWLERSVADLGSGRIERLYLSAGKRCFSVDAGWRRRFWRRRRPWWECFE